jgi:TorA maturation chaperone TorD
MQVVPISVSPRVAPEDQARADCYAMLAALVADAPAAELLRALAAAPRLAESDNAPLARAYNRLLDASAAVDSDAARQEHLDLFVGVGKSEVDPHASHWRRRLGGDHSLAQLRADLAELGLARLPASSLYEDHFAALCETMRMLIAGDELRAPGSVDQQRAFFARHLDGWTDAFCAAISASPLANYYKRVSEFVVVFMAVERDSLAID